MSELTSGLRAFEMHERQTWYRERAQRERTGVVTDPARRRLLRRVTRRAA